MSAGILGKSEGLRFTGTGVSGTCESLCMDVGNWTVALSKTSATINISLINAFATSVNLEHCTSILIFHGF